MIFLNLDFRILSKGFTQKNIKLNFLKYLILFIFSCTFSDLARSINLSCQSLFLLQRAEPLSILLLKDTNLGIGKFNNLNLINPDSIKFVDSNTKKPIIIHESDSHEKRLNLLKSFALDDLVVATGHHVLRNVKNISALADYIKKSNGGDFTKDQLLLNIITNNNGEVQFVDIWNSHHRLIAYKLLGYKNLGQIPAQNIHLLVNGVSREQSRWSHYLPVSGVNLALLSNYIPVKNMDVIPGTISVSGTLSNFQLGSRINIKGLFEWIRLDKKPKVGVFFGTFDPIHEGHVSLANASKKELGLDELIFVTNLNPLHKPGAVSSNDRIAMVSKRINREIGLNVYLGDSDRIIREFDKEQLIDQLKQISGADEVIEIIGSDAYEKLRLLQQLRTPSNRKYFVTVRDNEKPLIIPTDLKDIIITSSQIKDQGYSSTQVRELIKKGSVPSRNILSPEIYKYIRDHNLYSSSVKK